MIIQNNKRILDDAIKLFSTANLPFVKCDLKKKFEQNLIYFQKFFRIHFPLVTYAPVISAEKVKNVNNILICIFKEKNDLPDKRMSQIMILLNY